MDEIDRIGQRAAAVLVAEVHRRVDVEDALQRLHSGPVTTLIALDRPDHDDGAPPRRRVVRILGFAAAVAVLVAGALVLADRDDSRRLAPSDSVVVTPAPTTPVSSPPSTPASTDTAPSPTVDPSAPDVQRALVSVGASTPVLEGAVVLSQPIANTHPWSAAVTPSGRLFIGQLIDGATVAEVVGGQLFDTGIVASGGVRAGLDERLYALDSSAGRLVVWAQSQEGPWTIVGEHSVADDCDIDVQPDGVRCGDVVVPADPPDDDASIVSWTDDLQVSAITPDRLTTTWQIELDSVDLSLGNCQGTSCQQYARLPSGLLWTPVLASPTGLDARLVSFVQSDIPTVTAWLDCGGASTGRPATPGCQIVGADDRAVYTMSYAAAGEGDPAIVIRRFALADIYEGRSTPDPTLVDALADFPDRPPSTVTLDDVPLLLPAVPDGTSAVRSEGQGDPPTFRNYQQVWHGDGPGAPALTISTRLDEGPGVDGEPVDLAPWDRVFFTQMAPGYAQLILQDPSGVVSIWSTGLSRSDLLAIATTMHLRPDGQPGWQIDDVPVGLTAVNEGWSTGVAGRSIQWTGPDGPIEMSITHGGVDMFQTPWGPDGTTHVFDLAGTTAVAFEAATGDRSAVVYSPQPDVIVRLALYGSIDDAIAMARTIEPVDQATWQAASTIDTSTNDGCQSMFFC